MTEASARGLRVLWATDGSAAARAAVPILRQLVLPAASQLTVLAVAPHSFLSGARPDPAFLTGVSAAARRKALMESEQLARDEATFLDPPAGVRVEAVARWGNPIEEVLRALRSADMAVLGAKGHSNLGLLLLGSVAQGVVQNATKPVLIARPGTERVRRVLIGYDGSPAARRAIDFLGRLALDKSIAITAAQVVEPFTLPPGTPLAYREQAIKEAHAINERQHRHAERGLGVLAEKLRQGGWQVDTEVRVGPAAPTLEDIAQERGAQLIAVGSRKPSAVRHYLLGSTAEKLVRHAERSVLVVR